MALRAFVYKQSATAFVKLKEIFPVSSDLFTPCCSCWLMFPKVAISVVYLRNAFYTRRACTPDAPVAYMHFRWSVVSWFIHLPKEIESREKSNSWQCKNEGNILLMFLFVFFFFQILGFISFLTFLVDAILHYRITTSTQ